MATDSGTRKLEILPARIASFFRGTIELDVQAVAELRDHLKRLQRRLDGVTDPPLTHLIGACLTLTEALGRSAAAARAPLAAIRDILVYVEAVVGASSSDEGVSDHFSRMLHATRTGLAGGGLKMVNHQRLGEILRSLCLISDEDLQLALRVQQVTGKKIGDTLLEMGIASPEQIQNALHMQSLRPGGR